MRLVGLFGRYPAGRDGTEPRGDAFVGVYTSCTSDPTKDDIVLLNNIQAKSILVDDHCYNLISVKAVTAADYPGVGDPALTDPVPTITSGHDTCAECEALLPYEKWLKCADGSFAASLNPEHTDVDYAWLCIGGVWTKCYNASITSVTPTDPTVLKQTCLASAPSTCNDLTGLNVISVVIGNFDYDDGESFYTAPGSNDNLVYFNGSNNTSNSITWDSYNDAVSAFPVKFTIAGVEYQFGTPNFSDISANVGYNSAFNNSRYFNCFGYHLDDIEGSISKISIPISSSTTFTFPTYSGTFSVRLYKEEITNGTDLSLLTPVQTGTLTVTPADKGTWVDVTLSSGEVCDYDDNIWDPTGETCS